MAAVGTCLRSRSRLARASLRALFGLSLLVLFARVAVSLAAGEGPPTATATPAAVDGSSSNGAEDDLRARPEVAGAAPAQGEAEEHPGTFYLRAYWNRGINYKVSQPVHVGSGETVFLNQEASLTGRIGIRFAVDTAGFVERGQLPPIGAGIEIRRLFFYTTGEFRFVYPIYFRFDVGVVNGGFYLDENYLMVKDLPYAGTFKIGQFDAPMSLDLLTGSTARTFMEAAAPVQALASGLKAGMQLSNQVLDRRLTWAFGYFLDGQTPDVGDASQSFARLAGRVTWLAQQPNAPDDTLVHVGLSASYVLSSRAEIRYKSRPESYLAPALADTGVLDADDAFPFGAELALTRGPLLVQSEYLASVVTSADLGDPLFRGYYALAAWMLTGEGHPYDRSKGTFAPVIPTNTLAPCEGRWGGWEVAGRFSSVDLSQGIVRGGKMQIVSAGMNWYWNEYVRWMFNYEHAFIDQSADDGNLNVFQARFQLVF